MNLEATLDINASPIKADRLPKLATFFCVFVSVAFSNVRFLTYPTEVLYVLIILVVSTRSRIRLSSYSIWSYCFLLVCLASSLYSVDSFISFWQTLNVLRVLLVSNAMIIFIGNDIRKADFVLRSVLLGALFLVLWIVVRVPVTSLATARVGRELGLNPNQLGLRLAFASLISVYFGSQATGRRRLLFFCLGAVLPITAFLSGSRKAFVLVIVGWLGFAFLRNPKLRTVIRLLPIVILGIYGLWQTIMGVPVLYRVIGVRVQMLVQGVFGSGVLDPSAEARMNMISNGLRIFLRSPLFGHGIRSYEVLTHSAYSHNNYVELLVGVGLFGTAVYYALYVAIIWGLFRQIRHNSAAGLFLSSVVGLAIMEYGLVSYYSTFYHLIIACAYGALTALKSERNLQGVTVCSDTEGSFAREDDRFTREAN